MPPMPPIASLSLLIYTIDEESVVYYCLCRIVYILYPCISTIPLTYSRYSRYSLYLRYSAYSRYSRYATYSRTSLNLHQPIQLTISLSLSLSLSLCVSVCLSVSVCICIYLQIGNGSSDGDLVRAPFRGCLCTHCTHTLTLSHTDSLTHSTRERERERE